MTDPFLENNGGWTPTPDILVRKYGFEAAYLWGRLRRMCQQNNGKYVISHEALGNRIGMSRRTVIKYLDKLIEDGYVEDFDIGVKNRAHTYSVQKGEDKILSEVDGMQISHTNQDISDQETEPAGALDSDLGMRKMHTEPETGMQELPTGVQNLPTKTDRYAKNAQVGMQNLHLKRESLETSLKPESNPIKLSKRESPAPPPKFEPLTIALAEICEINLDLINRSAAKELAETQAAFIRAGKTPAQVLEFDQWRRRHHWSGSTTPSLKQVGQFWGQYEKWVSQGRPEAKAQNGANNGHKPTQPTGQRLKQERTFDFRTNEYVYPDGTREPVP